MMTRFRIPALVLVATLSLSACQSSEEKAEERYQSGLALLSQGDEDRAMIEFRNVFNLNGFHKEARRTYADLLVKRGQIGDATGQYLRLVEQYPDEGEVRRNLAELAVLRNDWEQAERQGREAVRLLPADPTARAVGALLDYRKAVLEKDTAAQAAVLDTVRALLDDPAMQAETPQPGLTGGAQLLRRILISTAMEAGDTATALPLIDASLAATPEDFTLNVMRLQALDKAGDQPGVGAQLRSMVDRFPDNAELRGSMISWLMSQKDHAGAEAFLRERAGDPTASTEGHVAVIQLIHATRGVEAARAEAESLMAANAGQPNADVYGSILAGYDFESGDRAGALSRIEAILAKAQPSDQTRKIRIMQARLLAADGDQVGARAQVETVLTEDPTNVDALKMRAAWLIQGDDPGAAIVDLRKALDQAPRDAGILTLMAEAHERDGARDLAGERLAMAVEVSNRAAPESLRYAAFLQRDGRADAALAVLNEARRASPANLSVLQALAQIHVGASDWDNATEVVTTMEQLPDPAAADAAKQVRAAILLGQGKTEEGMDFLSGLVDEGGLSGTGAGANDDRRAVAILMETMVRNGKIGEARTYIDGLLTKTPDDPFLVLMSAGLDAMAGKAEAAEKQYRDLIVQLPQSEMPVRMLYTLLASQNRLDDARAVLDAGLTAMPEAPQLLWIRAGLLERAGDIDGAIATYETLYARDTGNVVLANNLASLITTWRNDPASLDRAYAVARRLRGTTVPAFADTYGWIAFRRGEHDEALPYLETAAKGLAQDPVVQVHLGMAYAALNRTDEAKATLQKAIEMAGPDSTLAPVAEAKAKLAELGG